MIPFRYIIFSLKIDKKNRGHNMDAFKIAAACDHTLLRQDSALHEILTHCDEAIEYGAASVCIPPCFVEDAAKYVGDRIRICTVIGFPNGYNKTSIKAFEACEAVKDGAEELDMVINIGLLKDKKYDALLEDIKAVRAACEGKILKVIIETCLLNEEEKIKMCEIVTLSGADYIKTSTGFAGGGATLGDVTLFRKHIGEGVEIKVSGGVSSLEATEMFLSLGASRIGSSKIIKLLKEGESNEALGSVGY